jgi:hypothetical protein
LPGPKSNPRENAFVAPYKLAKNSTVPLWVNFSRKNFNARDPRVLNLALVPIRSCEIAGVYATL